MTGATSNDYYFITVRSESERSRPMPVPYGRVTFSSPDVNPVPVAPNVETLSAITVPPGARYDAPEVPGPEMIIVVTGSASVLVDTDQAAGRWWRGLHPGRRDTGDRESGKRYPPGTSLCRYVAFSSNQGELRGWGQRVT